MTYIPYKVLQYLFTFLPLKDLLIVGLTCKSFHKNSNDKFVWKEILENQMEYSNYLYDEDKLPFHRWNNAKKIVKNIFLTVHISTGEELFELEKRNRDLSKLKIFAISNSDHSIDTRYLEDSHIKIFSKMIQKAKELKALFLLINISCTYRSWYIDLSKLINLKIIGLDSTSSINILNTLKNSNSKIETVCMGNSFGNLSEQEAMDILWTDWDDFDDDDYNYAIKEYVCNIFKCIEYVPKLKQIYVQKYDKKMNDDKKLTDEIKLYIKQHKNKTENYKYDEIKLYIKQHKNKTANKYDETKKSVITIQYLNKNVEIYFCLDIYHIAEVENIIIPRY